MTGVLIKRENLDTDTQAECAVKIGLELPSAKELAKARKEAWTRRSLASRGCTLLPASQSWTSRLGNHEIINNRCLSHPVCVTIWQPQEADTDPGPLLTKPLFSPALGNLPLCVDHSHQHTNVP